jgi:hypothetical protein
MIVTKEDLIEIIGQDLAYARTKLKAFSRAFPETLRNALDACDDRIAHWSSRTIARNKRPSKGSHSDLS